jgi:RNase P subunit RPR2
MARARLHIICGNCGSNDMFKYRIVTEIDDDTNKEYQRVSIACDNCSTIHCLEDNAERE